MLFGFEPSRVAFSIAGFDIMWYGVIIAAAIGLAIVICCYRAPKHGLSADEMLSFLLICIPVGVIGARIYYVIFRWDLYEDNLLNIFNTRLGGLAVQGGIIAGFIACAILCKLWKENVLNLLDLAVPCIAAAQAIGRWGNFFNMEAYGSETDLPWALLIDGRYVHPTFLYESLWCFLLSFFLIFVDNRRTFYGQTLLLYCMLYSVERFFVEGLRTDSLMLFGALKQAQVLSVTVFIAALIAYIYLKKVNRKKDNVFINKG